MICDPEGNQWDEGSLIELGEPIGVGENEELVLDKARRMGVRRGELV